MDKDLVEVIEVWRLVETGGEAIRVSDGKHLERVAFLVGGRPIFLKEDYAVALRHITKEEAQNIRPN